MVLKILYLNYTNIMPPFIQINLTYFKTFLTRKIKIKFVFFIFLNLIGSILEVLNIWLLIPLLSLFADTSRMTFLLPYLNSLGINFDSEVNYISFFLILFIFISIISVFYRILVSRFKYDLIYIEIYSHLNSMLIVKFLRMELVSKLRVTSSNFISLFSTKIDSVCNKFFLSSINLLTNVIYLFLILIVAVIIAPSEVLFAIIIFLFYFIFTFFIRPVLVAQGHNINLSISKFVRLTNYSYSNFIENKIYNLEERIVTQIGDTSHFFGKSYSKNLLYSELPRQLLEFFIILSVVSFFYFNSLSSPSPNFDFPRIVAIGILFQKLLPVVQIVYSSFSSIVSASAMMSEINDWIREPAYINVDSNISSGNRRLTDFSYLQIESPVVYLGDRNIKYKNVFKISRGDNIAFIGRSGVGKSTLALAILGLYKSNGISWMFGSDHWSFSPPFSFYGYSGQKPVVFEGSIIENVTLKLREEVTSEDINRVLEILDALKLNYLVDKNHYFNNTSLDSLSGGELQRISIARMIYMKRELNIFDEATSALDSKTEEIVIEYLLSELASETCIFISHSMRVINRINNSIEVS